MQRRLVGLLGVATAAAILLNLGSGWLVPAPSEASRLADGAPSSTSGLVYQTYLPILSLAAPSLSANTSASFVDTFQNPTSGWPTKDTPSYAMGYVNAHYDVNVKQPGYTVLVCPQLQATDFAAEADGQLVSEPSGQFDGSYGLFFAATSAGFYSFEVMPLLGEVRLLKWDFANGVFTELFHAIGGAIQSGSSVNRLKATRQGPTIELWVNDELVGSVVDTRFPTGSVGLIASGYTTGFPAGFNRFALTTVGPASPQLARTSTAATSLPLRWFGPSALGQAVQIVTPNN